MAIMDSAALSALITPAFIDSVSAELRPLSIFFQLARELPALRRVGSFTLPALIESGPDNFRWIREAEEKPISDITLSRPEITMRKVSTICYVSEEAVADSFTDLMALLRGAIVRGAVQEIDEQMWRGVGPTTDANNPLGILNQSSVQTIAKAASIDLSIADAILAIRLQDGMSPTRIVMHPGHLHELQQMRTQNDFAVKYPSTQAVGSPSLFGIPISLTQAMTSASMTTTDGFESDLVVLDARFLEAYRAPASIKVSDVASLRDGSTSHSMFQHDEVGIRYVEYISDPRLVRPNALAVVSGHEIQVP